MIFSPALLVLEDGTTFTGRAFGATGETFGEAVFTTGMTGYQETLTDPSYFQQIVIQTAPHIGNTGINDEDDESARIWVSGYVVRDPARVASNWRSKRTLDQELVQQKIVGIAGIDTRALTRHLRDKGAMRAGIFSQNIDDHEKEYFLNKVKSSPQMKGADLCGMVSTKKSFVVPAVGKKLYQVAAIDLGMKNAILQNLTTRGIELTVLPVTASADEVLAAGIDGVFLSNGPGDPETATHAIAVTKEILKVNRTLFGICFGNQILGRALGFETYKLTFGHRGINQPVLDRTTGKVEITTHNHGFAVKAPLDRETETEFGRVEVSHICLNDNVVEGLALKDKPAFSVQYHPEAAAGPHDAGYLFDRFTALMDKNNA
jgi:carbamoyl-phosphate synthase small subunit